MVRPILGMRTAEGKQAREVEQHVEGQLKKVASNISAVKDTLTEVMKNADEQKDR